MFLGAETVPFQTPKLGLDGSLFERDAVAEGLTITSEVMVVQDVEHLGANLHLNLFFEVDLLRDRQVDVLIAGPRTLLTRGPVPR